MDWGLWMLWHVYVYCNIERIIMKNQFGSPGFGIQGRSLCIFVLTLVIVYLWFYNSHAGNFRMGLKPTIPLRFWIEA